MLVKGSAFALTLDASQNGGWFVHVPWRVWKISMLGYLVPARAM